MKRLIMDIDGTLSHTEAGDYAGARPIAPVVRRLREYREQGFEIVLHSSRNMRTFNGNVGRINAVTLPPLIAWLNANNVPFDEIYMGKPWCGHSGFYVDDRAVRPDEFAQRSIEQLRETIEAAAQRLARLEE